MHTSLPLIDVLIICTSIAVGAYSQDIDERLVCKLVLLCETSIKHYTDLFIVMNSNDRLYGTMR